MSGNTDEQRQHPRYRAFVPIQVSNLQLYTVNVSDNGLQISCPELMTSVLQKELDNGPVRIDMTLPGAQAVQVNGRMIYSQDFGDERLIGIEITEFINGSEAAYAEYIQGLANKSPSG